MQVIMLLVYVFSHFIGFAGFGILWFFRQLMPNKAVTKYLRFLVAFFLVVIGKNAWFFCQNFLHYADWELTPWAFAYSMVSASLFLWFYLQFLQAITNHAFKGKAQFTSIFYSLLPLIILAVQISLEAFGLGSRQLSWAFLQASDGLLVALIFYSLFALAKYQKKSRSPLNAQMMRLALVRNVLFLVPLVWQIVYNYNPENKLRPLSVETILYLVLNCENLILLFRRANQRKQQTRANATVAFNDREQQIINLIAKGLANKQIAAELGIPEITVRNTIYRLFKILGVRNRVELLRNLSLISQ